MQTLTKLTSGVCKFYQREIVKKKKKVHENNNVVCFRPDPEPSCARGCIAVETEPSQSLVGFPQWSGWGSGSPSAACRLGRGWSGHFLSTLFLVVFDLIWLCWTWLAIGHSCGCKNGGHGEGGGVGTIPRKSTWHSVTFPSTSNIQHSCKNFNQ